MLSRQNHSCQIPSTLASTSTPWPFGGTLSFYSTDLRPLGPYPISRDTANPRTHRWNMHAHMPHPSFHSNIRAYLSIDLQSITNTINLCWYKFLRDQTMWHRSGMLMRRREESFLLKPPVLSHGVHNGRIDGNRWRYSSHALTWYYGHNRDHSKSGVLFSCTHKVSYNGKLDSFLTDMYLISCFTTT